MGLIDDLFYSTEETQISSGVEKGIEASPKHLIGFANIVKTNPENFEVLINYNGNYKSSSIEKSIDNAQTTLFQYIRISQKEAPQGYSQHTFGLASKPLNNTPQDRPLDASQIELIRNNIELIFPGLDVYIDKHI